MAQEPGTPGIGLGAEKNAQIAEFLQAGNSAGLLDIISGADNPEQACEVVQVSMFHFGGDRVASANGLMNAALDNPIKYGGAMKALVKYAWEHNATTERFWKNPKNGETLYIDGDGELISFKGEIGTIPEGVKGSGERYVRTLASYTVLTGPNTGKTFRGAERGIPPLS